MKCALLHWLFFLFFLFLHDSLDMKEKKKEKSVGCACIDGLHLFQTSMQEKSIPP
ncbi:hypothetical protein CSUI_009754 [Cystoisospora suis]|uniref:Uncharacterized protein n=1 Tax=Cystoisospora suis TaxID=483139 RepID=A0A2C6KIV7_9APIC|nr:hypothetical protein CSUI_009754 [Cystoisospora suis]